MLDFVTQNNAADVLRFFFIFEFGRVNPNYHKFIRILLFQPLQIRNDVHAIYAAVSPKVEQDNFAPQR